MIDPVSAAAVASVGANMMGQTGNIISDLYTNYQNRKLAKEMYQTQLADNRENWRMQNEYNHPLQQMNRLRQAGLNPNLVYGKGAEATAGSIAGANPKVPELRAPKVDLSNIGTPLLQAVDVKAKQAQTDNVNKQNALLDLKRTQMELGITNQEIKNSRDALTTGILKASYNDQIENFVLKNEAIKISNQTGVNTNKLMEATRGDNIKRNYQQLLNEQMQGENMKINNANMKLQNKMLELKQTSEELVQDKLRKEIAKIEQDLSLFEQRKSQLENTNYNLFVKGEYDNLKYQMSKLGVPENSPYMWKAIMTKGTVFQDELWRTGKFDRDVVQGKKKTWKDDIMDSSWKKVKEKYDYIRNYGR